MTIAKVLEPSIEGCSRSPDYMAMLVLLRAEEARVVAREERADDQSVPTPRLVIERAGGRRLPQVSLSRRARLCCSCMKRKARWVFTLDPENVGNRSVIPGFGALLMAAPYSRRRVCFGCMGEAMKESIRRLYA